MTVTFSEKMTGLCVECFLIDEPERDVGEAPRSVTRTVGTASIFLL
jgi:hypothetical protein